MTWPPSPPDATARYLLDGEVVKLLRIDERKANRTAAMAELRRLRSRHPQFRAAYLGRSSGSGLWDRGRIDAWLNGDECR